MLLQNECLSFDMLISLGVSVETAKASVLFDNLLNGIPVQFAAYLRLHLVQFREVDVSQARRVASYV